MQSSGRYSRWRWDFGGDSEAGGGGDSSQRKPGFGCGVTEAVGPGKLRAAKEPCEPRGRGVCWLAPLGPRGERGRWGKLPVPDRVLAVGARVLRAHFATVRLHVPSVFS